ncbi:amidase family protein [Alphaproteobacteria bacterium]|nr:amidase family protein [Alphaproteobacteria bacterium]
MDNTNHYSICDLLKIYRLKKVSPVEYLQNTIKNIENINPKLNAFISIDKKTYIKQAKLSEQNFFNKTERKLEGIPFGIKDVIDKQSEKTLNNCRGFLDSIIKKKMR